MKKRKKNSYWVEATTIIVSQYIVEAESEEDARNMVYPEMTPESPVDKRFFVERVELLAD